MSRARSVLVWVALVMAVSVLAAPALAAEAAFDVVRDEWRDPARARTIPVKLVVPRAPGPHPVILFSHGLGATREGYSYLSEHWARRGYVTVHLQHEGTDSRIFRDGITRKAAMQEAVADWSRALARPLDVRFAVDRLAGEVRRRSPIGARLDLDRVGAAGHSFGAWTSLVLAGQRIPDRADGPLASAGAYADPRVRAILAMSPPVRRGRAEATLDEVYGGITVPLMVMAGTHDLSPIGDQRPEERRIPFDLSGSRDGALITFRWGDHWIYSGRGWKRKPQDTDLRYQRLICEASTAFWDAHLRGRDSARAWMRAGGLKQRLGQLAYLEVKR